MPTSYEYCIPSLRPCTRTSAPKDHRLMLWNEADATVMAGNSERQLDQEPQAEAG